MLHFYDGQIRRYLLQTIRVLSNFTVKYGDGRLVRIPVVYGDADRQAASIMRQNSENKINSTPRISVYINGLSMDTSRLADSTYIGKTHVRERAINEATGEYTTGQGANYTVERLMPTPFKLTMKCDLWSANTDQKLQILEQILVLFNPTLELQTTDNYIDWTSLTTLEIKDLIWSSRNVPVGADTPIDIATITFETPIWLNPPVKIKQMGIITQIITSMQTGITPPEATYIDGLGTDPIADGAQTGINTVAIAYANVSGYKVQVYNNTIQLLGRNNTLLQIGSGATFNVEVVGDSRPDTSFNVTIINPGEKYSVGDLLRIENSLFNGRDDNGEYMPDEITIEVTSIEEPSAPAREKNPTWKRYGEITGIKVWGHSPGGNITFNNLPSYILKSSNDAHRLDVPGLQGPAVSWFSVFDQYPGQYKAGYTQIFLKQPNGNEVIGSVALHPDDNTLLIVNWDSDTNPSDTFIDSQGRLDNHPDYGAGDQHRSGSPGTFDAIVNPLTFNPKRPNKEGSDQPITAGRRYLIIEDIGSSGFQETDVVDNPEYGSADSYGRLPPELATNTAITNKFSPGPNSFYSIPQKIARRGPGNSIEYNTNLNEDGPDGWKSVSGADFVAKENDIIEWSGSTWVVIFNAASNQDPPDPVYQTNIYTRVQYKWDGLAWTKSFEGEYREGGWRLRL